MAKKPDYKQSKEEIQKMWAHEAAHRNAYGGTSATGYDGEKMYTGFGKEGTRRILQEEPGTEHVNEDYVNKRKQTKKNLKRGMKKNSYGIVDRLLRAK